MLIFCVLPSAVCTLYVAVFIIWIDSNIGYQSVLRWFGHYLLFHTSFENLPRNHNMVVWSESLSNICIPYCVDVVGIWFLMDMRYWLSSEPYLPLRFTGGWWSTSYTSAYLRGPLWIRNPIFANRCYITSRQSQIASGTVPGWSSSNQFGSSHLIDEFDSPHYNCLNIGMIVSEKVIVT